MRVPIVLAAVLVGLFACGGLGPDCHAGDMRCSGNMAQMCNIDEHWESWQDCGSIGERCSTAPANCSGYTGIACCY